MSFIYLSIKFKMVINKLKLSVLAIYTECLKNMYLLSDKYISILASDSYLEVYMCLLSVKYTSIHIYV